MTGSSLTSLYSDNTVQITSGSDNCIVVPRTPHTDVGDSEHPGGMQVSLSSYPLTCSPTCSCLGLLHPADGLEPRSAA
jgi:hypothetical protein